jgi:hypothetical protein
MPVLLTGHATMCHAYLFCLLYNILCNRFRDFVVRMHAHLLWPVLIFGPRLDHARALTGHAITAKHRLLCTESTQMQRSVLDRLPAAATSLITSIVPWRSTSLALHCRVPLQYCTN